MPFRHLLEARSIDIVMIDLLRVGGITQWMKVAGMAEAFNLPVVSHLIPEIHVHLIAAIPNGLTVEYMPWTLRLFEETPAIEDGQLVVPNEAGPRARLRPGRDQALPGRLRPRSDRGLWLGARRAGPVVGGGGRAASFATLRRVNRSPAGCAHSRRAHSAGCAAAAPDATRPVTSVRLLDFRRVWRRGVA